MTDEVFGLPADNPMTAEVRPVIEDFKNYFFNHNAAGGRGYFLPQPELKIVRAVLDEALPVRDVDIQEPPMWPVKMGTNYDGALTYIHKVKGGRDIYFFANSLDQTVNTKIAFRGEAIPVEAWDREQKAKLATGRLVTLDNQIDPATGTVKLRAEFANDDLALFPNQFVNVRMLLSTLPDATLVPTAAIQRGAPGTFVYAVKDDRTVAVAPVKLGPVQGEATAIADGIAPGTLVVVDGTDKLREGARVELITRDGQAAQPP